MGKHSTNPSSPKKTCLTSSFFFLIQWPNPGPLANGDEGKYLNLSSGVSVWYTTFGKASDKTPVLLLHGGEGISNQMFNQANYLAKTRQVILQEYVLVAFLMFIDWQMTPFQYSRRRT
jgi:hypothetical protein